MTDHVVHEVEGEYRGDGHRAWFGQLFSRVAIPGSRDIIYAGAEGPIHLAMKPMSLSTESYLETVRNTFPYEYIAKLEKQIKDWEIRWKMRPEGEYVKSMMDNIACLKDE